MEEFPGGGPVIRTQFFQCKGSGLNPWSGNQDPINGVMLPKKRKNMPMPSSSLLAVIRWERDFSSSVAFAMATAVPAASNSPKSLLLSPNTRISSRGIPRENASSETTSNKIFPRLRKTTTTNYRLFPLPCLFYI